MLRSCRVRTVAAVGALAAALGLLIGPADATVSFGRSGDRYLVGDWDGDGDFTPGVQRAGTFCLRNSGGSGPSEVHVRFGHPSDHGFAGDWNGTGTWTRGSCAAAPAGS
jgi:hypothetical protein